MRDIYILGGYQTDFAVNWAKQDQGVFDILDTSVKGALEATDLDSSDIDVAHVGNFAGELFTGQGHLGGLFGSLDPAFDGVPSVRHEAACASGSMAALGAAAEIEAGRYDVAAVVGIEQMRNVSTPEAAEYLGSALWVGVEAVGEAFPWPAQFSDIADEYDRRYGLEYEHLMVIAEKAFDNAKRNPNAQSRSWQFEDDAFGEDDDLNPPVAGRIRKLDCARITDGAAAVILASGEWAAEYAARRGRRLEDIPRISGWGHRTTAMKLHDKLVGAATSATSSRIYGEPSPMRGNGRVSEVRKHWMPSRPTTVSRSPSTWPWITSGSPSRVRRGKHSTIESPTSKVLCRSIRPVA